MNEPGALDERLRTLVMQFFEGGGERLQTFNTVSRVNLPITKSRLQLFSREPMCLQLFSALSIHFSGKAFFLSVS
ncbi:MAG: hypothetical protein GY702_26920 [Desulfobulbaceae bacterium]|nr:hypothetical protein [Desulfobulbaceae bacterium]